MLHCRSCRDTVFGGKKWEREREQQLSVMVVHWPRWYLKLTGCFPHVDDHIYFFCLLGPRLLFCLLGYPLGLSQKHFASSTSCFSMLCRAVSMQGTLNLLASEYLFALVRQEPQKNSGCGSSLLVWIPELYKRASLLLQLLTGFYTGGGPCDFPPRIPKVITVLVYNSRPSNRSNNTKIYSEVHQSPTRLQ